MPRPKPPILNDGDVIKTHPNEGFWGCAVVLKSKDKTGRFDPLCLIGVTPIIFRHDFVWREVASLPFSVLEFDREIRQVPGQTQARHETCIGCFDARPHPELPTIGTVAVSEVFSGPLGFEVGDASDGKWPLCGRISPRLGYEAVLEWRRKYDQLQWKKEVAAAEKDYEEMVARLQREERDKRLARKNRKD
jgi:hypothetical protein